MGHIAQLGAQSANLSCFGRLLKERATQAQRRLVCETTELPATITPRNRQFWEKR